MKAKILLLDDEPEQIQAFAQVLALEGYETVVAQDDLWAMYLIDEFQPDLVVLDIRCERPAPKPASVPDSGNWRADDHPTRAGAYRDAQDLL